MTVFYDKLAVVALWIGDHLSQPFYRIERWAYRRWKATRS